MTIALIAHDSKKELMVQFCTAYCRILSQHKLVATGTTGKLIAEATGLQVQRFLAGVQGGDQQIASRIACNEIDLLLFFRDPINAKPSEPNEMTLLRLCDVHNIFTSPDWGFTGHDLTDELLLILQNLPHIRIKSVLRHIPEYLYFVILVSLSQGLDGKLVRPQDVPLLSQGM